MRWIALVCVVLLFGCGVDFNLADGSGKEKKKLPAYGPQDITNLYGEVKRLRDEVDALTVALYDQTDAMWISTEEAKQSGYYAYEASRALYKHFKLDAIWSEVETRYVVMERPSVRRGG